MIARKSENSRQSVDRLPEIKVYLLDLSVDIVGIYVETDPPEGRNRFCPLMGLIFVRVLLG